MEKLRRLFCTYKLRVDDKGRLKVPRDVEDALREKRQVLVISLLWQTVRIYPLGGSVSQRIVLGDKRTKQAREKTKWTGTKSALLGIGEADPVLFEHLGRARVTEMDLLGRVLVAPHGSYEKSDVGMENEDVLLRWEEDHFIVITANRGDFPDSLWWTA